MIQLIKSNGEVTDNFTADTLQEKQDAVGGYIEVVATRKGKVLIVNEAIWKGLKKNKKASEIAEFHLRRCHRLDERLPQFFKLKSSTMKSIYQAQILKEKLRSNKTKVLYKDYKTI